MSIIDPSRNFEGSDISGSKYGRLIKEDVRTVSFKEEKNKFGNFFYLLPAYKADTNGRGVWYKQIRVRKNFGIDVKESFAIQPNDPISYFESQAKLYFPEYTAVKEVVQGTKKFKVYPTSGNVTSSIVYNAAYVSELELGAHVLAVPSFYVGQTIDTWTRSKDAKGNPRPMLNDYKKAIPIKIQLRSGSDIIGNPWLIEIDASQNEALPAELADTDYLYDLDTVIYYPDPAYLIEKLQAITPTSIFDACMKDFLSQSVRGIDIPDAEESDFSPTTKPAPVQVQPVKKTIPKAVKSTEPATVAPSAEVPKEAVASESNPSAAPMTPGDIQNFLRKKPVAKV